MYRAYSFNGTVLVMNKIQKILDIKHKHFYKTQMFKLSCCINPIKDFVNSALSYYYDIIILQKFIQTLFKTSLVIKNFCV